MTILVLFILAVVWVAALLPPWLRNRGEGRPATSIVSFHQQLSTLQRATPGARARSVGSVPAPRGMTLSTARRRRRDILSTLAAATVLTFLMALVLRGVAIVAFLVVAALLFTYTASLIHLHRRAAERDAKVRYLVPKQARPQPALLLRRSASH